LRSLNHRSGIIAERTVILLFPVAILFFFLSGCQKQEHFPDTPEIEYMNYFNVFTLTSQYAVKGILTFSYHDGDGDIGYAGYDTLPPFQQGGQFYYNLVVKYYEMQNGAMVERILDPPLSSRIPVLNPLDPGRAIKGTITDTLQMDPNPVHDTIQLKVFIYDRTLHKSNVISTPVIILKRR
jgi:hypothetical protein